MARGAETALYELPNERFDALPKSVVAFRQKTLSNFVATDAQRFEIAFADTSAPGSTQVVTVSGDRDDDGLDHAARADGGPVSRRASSPSSRV